MILGLVFSTVITPALLGMISNSASLLLRAQPDARVLWFSIAVSTAAGVLFGIAPVLQGTRLDVAFALKDAASAVAGTGSSARLRKTLISMQVALSFLLLAGASLFTRTLVNLGDTRTGFRDIEHVATFQVDPAKLGYPPLRIRNFHQDLPRAITETPGVQSAAYSVVPVFRGT